VVWPSSGSFQPLSSLLPPLEMPSTSVSNDQYLSSQTRLRSVLHAETTVVALSNYPSSFFEAIMTAGLFLVRRQRKRLNLPPSEYRSWTFVVLFFLAAKIFLLVMPWVPPPGGINAGAYSFFYAASSLTGLGIIGLCGLYYLVWTQWLPSWGNYSLRQIVVGHADGAVSHEIIKVKNDELDEWDRKHDPSGRSLNESEGNI